MSLYVVYVPETGHVIGAIDAADLILPTDTKADVLVGDALPLRVSLGGGEVDSLPLPASDLRVHKPDNEPRVFANPLAWAVAPGTGTTPKPALTQLLPWANPDVALSKGNVVIAFPDPVDEDQDTPVLVVVGTGQSVLVRPGKITAGDHSAVIDLPVNVPPGAHGVLALVAGRTGALLALTTK